MRILINSYTIWALFITTWGSMTAPVQLLEEGLKIGKLPANKGRKDLSNLYNNLGNTYYFLKQYDKALRLFPE